jgi:hypothetical protein
VLSTDHLSTQTSWETQTALIAWPEVTVLCLPQEACWLHVRAPRWQPLRSLARKGRRFERIDEALDAIVQAPTDWNPHRDPDSWKKAA